MKNKMLLKVMALATLTVLAGCETAETPVSSVRNSHDISSTNSRIHASKVEKKDLPILHEVEYNGKKFEIETTYSIEERFANSWYYTIPNEIDMKVKTINLPEDLEVIVTNVYADISVSSGYSRYNGLRQDSLSLNYNSIGKGGFNINDSNSYYQPFQVEGVNASEMFITQWHGYGSTSYSYLKEWEINRYSDGVLLNSVFTLGIKEKNSDEIYNHTIKDSIFIKSNKEEE